MSDKPTRQELERQFDELCDQYVRRPHNEVTGRRIIELRKQLADSAIVKIFLDVQSYESLIAHISPESACRATLIDAHLLGNMRIVKCNETLAHHLLVTAQEHCSDAITRIIDAICIARLTL